MEKEKRFRGWVLRGETLFFRMQILERWSSSPVWVRVAPFVVFAGLTLLQGRLGPASAYWVYLLKVLIGGAMVWWLWPKIPEMRWKVSWAGVLVGVFVFVLWAGLDPFYPKWRGSSDSVWNPHDYYGSGSAAAWFFIVVRMFGVTLVVPLIEEVFYRSFLYRYIANPDFQKLPIGFFGWTPFLVTSAVFGVAHFEWLAGVLCGLAYQSLVIWKGRLGDAITAHATTNFLLGIWVNVAGMWFFW